MRSGGASALEIAPLGSPEIYSIGAAVGGIVGGYLSEFIVHC